MDVFYEIEKLKQWANSIQKMNEGGYFNWVTEQSVFYLHRIDWIYLIENEVELWLLEMKLWASKN